MDQKESQPSETTLDIYWDKHGTWASVLVVRGQNRSNMKRHRAVSDEEESKCAFRECGFGYSLVTGPAAGLITDLWRGIVGAWMG